MSGRWPRVLAVLVIAVVAMASIGADAATNSSSGAKDGVTYRWTDEQGVVHYGDRIPPQYAQQERSVLNSQGVEVRKLDAQKTPEQRAADERIQQGIIRQKQHDA